MATFGFDGGISTNSTPTVISGNTPGFSGGRFFYSNNPETLTSLSGNLKLAYGTVSGETQVYAWHLNSTGKTIANAIHIYNPGSTSITVTVIKQGLTRVTGSTGNDVTAWKSYLNGSGYESPVTINSKESKLFLKRTINSGEMFGTLALLNISGSAVISEVVSDSTSYVFPSDSASITLANKDTSVSRRRGVGNSFITTFTDTILFDSAFLHKGLTISAPSDSYNGKDMVYITDPSGACSGYLYGSYGQYLKFKLIIDYRTGASELNRGKRLKLCLGSLGGNSIPFIVANNTQYTSNTISYYNYADFAYIGDAGNPFYDVVNFDLVIPAQASTAYGIFARAQ